MEILAENLRQKAQKLGDEIKSFRIKLIATQNDYDNMSQIVQSYQEGKIDFETYAKVINEYSDMIGRRWGIGVENN